MACDDCFAGSPERAWANLRGKKGRGLVDEAHFSAALGQCAACGQRWVDLFCERIDWVGGEDPQTWMLVPLDDAEAEALAAAGDGVERAVGAIEPKRECLVAHHPSDAEMSVAWVFGPYGVPPHD